ncbi:MAG: hypothetical protein H7301_05160 [Cryobacterium sp.]|nr:hypothetical protein [Oligoflexia bacterium]
MSSYSDSYRNAKNTQSKPATSQTPVGIDPVTKEAQIKVDGFGQVIALLEVADPSFRDSLINRIAAKDPQLARQIRSTLGMN